MHTNKKEASATLGDYIPVTVNLTGVNDITIYPVFDVHIGAREYLRKEFEAFIKFIKDTPDAYIVIGGDVLNNAIKSSVSDVYSEVLMPGEAKQYAIELFRPIKDKILCGVGGNHEIRTTKETNQDILYDVFCCLDIENRYRQNMAIVSVSLKPWKSSSCARKTFMVTHGAGGGTTLAAGINRQDRFIRGFEGIDVFISGHTHKPAAVPISKLKYIPVKKSFQEQTIWLVTASSWLSYAGYAARKMYAPCARCGVMIHFYARHTNSHESLSRIEVNLTEGG